MNKDLLEMLQVFHDADDDSNGGGTPPNPEDGDKDDDSENTLDVENLTDEQVKAIKEKFGFKDDNEVDSIVKSKHARLREEAEKLAKMNQEEKEKYELEKMKKELEEYKKKDQYYALSKEAQKMLSEHDIHADDDLLSIVVKDDAEATKTAVNTFVSLINTKVEEGIKKALQGKPPKVNMQTGKPITKESIMAIKDDQERQKAIRENQKLFL